MEDRFGDVCEVWIIGVDWGLRELRREFSLDFEEGNVEWVGILFSRSEEFEDLQFV